MWFRNLIRRLNANEHHIKRNGFQNFLLLFTFLGVVVLLNNVIINNQIKGAVRQIMFLD